MNKLAYMKAFLPTLETTGWASIISPRIYEETQVLATELSTIFAQLGFSFDETFNQLLRMTSVSNFALDTLKKNSSNKNYMHVEDWFRALTSEHMKSRLKVSMENIADLESLQKELRICRNQMMLRLMFRDLNGLASLQETMHELSEFAEQTMEAGLNFLYPKLCQEMGTPYANGKLQSMFVIGLGKLGAHELNLSSDVDLIFGFSANGETQNGKKVYTNQEFFTRLGRRLIKLLSEVTAEGFVFRVDMRLRPFGQSGALVWSSQAMLEYYEQHGREWERYAMIKARPVAGDRAAAQKFLDELRPFVFRRYIDFGVIGSLREMKALIRRDVKRKGAENNIKIGSGGIREIEFIAQVFQLLRGGQCIELRTPKLLSVLPFCLSLNLLPKNEVEDLITAYHFLRHLEHRLQGFQDRQTQTLPTDQNIQTRIAWSMGYQHWADLSEELVRLRHQVHLYFNDLIKDPNVSKSSEQKTSEQDADLLWVACWKTSDLQNTVEEKASEEKVSEERSDVETEGKVDHRCSLIRQLEDVKISDPEALLNCLSHFKKTCANKRLQAISLDRLDQIMPLLLENIFERHQKVETNTTWAMLSTDKFIVSSELRIQWPGMLVTLERILVLFEAILRRSAYFALFIENPPALRELVKLCGASPWIADKLAAYPHLLDELLDSVTLYRVPNKMTLKDELRQQLLRVPADDLEMQMETLRSFKQTHVLRIAAAEVASRLALMKVSDYLTFLAEVILDAVLNLAWEQTTAKFGSPTDANGKVTGQHFIMVGYGKLGGIELSYGSDLDLVFIYNAPSFNETTGPKKVENVVFFTRLVKRIVHILSTHTLGGILYDVDLRLRPSGDSGLMVSSIDAFLRYQQKDAWNWEHQALVRARVVAGAVGVGREFTRVRAEILSEKKDPAFLRAKVIDMRMKMSQHLGSKTAADQFHLKYDSGGIVDIEFIAQYLVLLHASRVVSLVDCTDNVRIFECLAHEGIMNECDSQSLIDAYLLYRAATHRLVLQKMSPLLNHRILADTRKVVTKHWRNILGQSQVNSKSEQ